MNEMRKLMEAIEQINEGWDVHGIAQAIYDEIRDPQSPVNKAWEESNEPYRAAIYTYGQLSRLFNPEAIDGSEIYHKIVDELEELVVMGESVEQISESNSNVAFAIYTSEDGNGRFPGWQYIRGIVIIPDTRNYSTNKSLAIKTAVKNGILPEGSIGFASAYQIDRDEIDALRNVVDQLKGL